MTDHIDTPIFGGPGRVYDTLAPETVAAPDQPAKLSSATPVVAEEAAVEIQHEDHSVPLEEEKSQDETQNEEAH